MYEYFDDYEEVHDDEYEVFADSYSALRAVTPNNPRNQPCPTCGYPDRLTPKDVELGYQCNKCADAEELEIDIIYHDD